jgi:hypothetical protein
VENFIDRRIQEVATQANQESFFRTKYRGMLAHMQFEEHIASVNDNIRVGRKTHNTTKVQFKKKMSLDIPKTLQNKSLSQVLRVPCGGCRKTCQHIQES